MAKITVSNQTTPAAPSTGRTTVYTDTTTKRLKSIDDAGTIVDYTPGGEANTASNIGSGSGVFNQKTGVNLEFKSLNATGVVTVTPNASDITISSSAEANTASNLGAGSQVFKSKVGVDLQFRSITAGSGVTLVQNANDISISSSAVSDPFSTMELTDHFASGDDLTGRVGVYSWAVSNAGTGNSAARIPSELRRNGIYRVNAGTTAAGRSCLYLGESAQQLIDPAGASTPITYKTRVRLTGTLSTFEMAVFGLGDIPGAVGDQNNGVYFQILGSPTPDTNWQLVSANAGTRTRLTTGIAFATGVWHDFEFTWTSAGITGKVDGTPFSGSITTNIPTVVTLPLYKTDAIVSGTAVNLDVDIFYLIRTGMVL